MAIFIISFLAGVLTILAPCVLPMLPIILGGTLNQSNYKRIVTIIVSFMISIIVFTFLLKVSTAFIDILPHTWSVISGVILILFGIVTLFPNSWERFKLFLRLPQVSGPEKSDSVWGQILLGASLGPIFSTCSPTYTLIIATILPLSLWAGVTSIILYALGLGLVLGAVAIFGRTLIKKLNIISDSNGVFKKILGIIILVAGLAIVSGYDKKLEAKLIDLGFNTSSFEQSLIDKYQKADQPVAAVSGAMNLSGYIDYDEKIISSLTGDIVLFFHADRCPTCRQAEDNFRASGIPAGLTIVKVDYDKEIELKKKYRILTQTSFVYIKPDGTLIKRRVGGLTIQDMLDKITDAKANSGSNEPKRVASDQTATAYFAGGCFRCMEGPLESLEGVREVINGYIGGTISDSTYEQVSRGTTANRESVKVLYDPALITYEELLSTYRIQIDPTDAGGQFADRGNQYKTAIYYSNDEEKKIATLSKEKLNNSKKYDKPIVVDILPASTFYKAEEYHQDYYKKHSAEYKSYKKGSGREDFIEENLKKDAASMSVVSRKDKKPKEISELTDEQRRILIEGGTETPFQNAYRDNHEEGIYVDVIDGTPLFSSTDKFDSETGRPSFTRPIEESLVNSGTDTTYKETRTEIKSKNSQGHLGHVFDDGPAESGGNRYCINSAALEFVPRAELDAKGYGEYKKLFEK